MEELKYMVSYQLYDGNCGNRCGSKEEVKEYRDKHKQEWSSYSFFSYENLPNKVLDLTHVLLD